MIFNSRQTLFGSDNQGGYDGWGMSEIWGFGKRVAEAIDYLQDLGVDAMITFKCILKT